MCRLAPIEPICMVQEMVAMVTRLARQRDCVPAVRRLWEWRWSLVQRMVAENSVQWYVELNERFVKKRQKASVPELPKMEGDI